ncbi:hypothetical protein GCM10011504_27790 [Siccirubricoccus deserti]|nr:tripartite tricarboxylate transporter substrate binding protein [Siccirubricoccus deserti]GGC47812.1 hypothetical protein GCM10011504_27790 [Siccirubricoccus deserti]
MRLTRRASMMIPFLAMPAVRPARGQGYPSRAVRIVVAYPPGGATDIVARKVAEAIAPTLGQPVIVENRPGGSGTIGTGEVARAQPDGHTLLAMDSSYCMLPYVFARLPWDHAQDLLPVTVCNFAPVVLAVKANARWPDLAALMAEARANPARITYGTGGVGSSLHFAGEDFQHDAGIELYHIPFKGAGEATLGLLSGTVDLVMGSTPSAMANLRAGTIRALAVCGRQRVAALPEVPTFAEAGADLRRGRGAGFPDGQLDRAGRAEGHAGGEHQPAATGGERGAGDRADAAVLPRAGGDHGRHATGGV